MQHFTETSEGFLKFDKAILIVCVLDQSISTSSSDQPLQLNLVIRSNYSWQHCARICRWHDGEPNGTEQFSTLRGEPRCAAKCRWEVFEYSAAKLASAKFRCSFRAIQYNR